jgi:branched-chain amino acid transport system substrate-binding protein
VRARAAAVTAVLAVAAVLALTVAGCGGTHRTHRRKGDQAIAPPGYVDVYASLPLHGAAGPAGAEYLEGIDLAWAQSRHRAGPFRVRLRVLDSSPASRTGGSGPVVANAQKAATDPDAIAYIGELSGTATEQSLPILNEAGIAQITPAASPLGLTERIAGVTPKGQPEMFYPSGTRTLFRLLPTQAVEAAADLLALRAAGCARVALAHDTTSDGLTLARLLTAEKSLYGVAIVAGGAGRDGAYDLPRLAQRFKLAGTECLAFAGSNPAAAALLSRRVHALLPTIPVLLTDGLCNTAGAAALAVPPPVLVCTRLQLPVTAYPGGPAFQAAVAAGQPNVRVASQTLVGYEAMRLVLDTVSSLGRSGDVRAAVVRALHLLRGRRSPLGVYGFTAGGDTTLRAIGLLRVSPITRTLVFSRVLAPPRVL